MTRNINAIVSNIDLLNYWTNRACAAAVDWGIVWFVMAVFSLQVLSFSFLWNYGIVLLFYFTFLEYFFRTTPGKRIFSIHLDGDFTILAAFVRNLSKIHLSILAFELFYSAMISSDPKKRFLDSFTDISVYAPPVLSDFGSVSMIPSKASAEPQYAGMQEKEKEKEKKVPAWKLSILRAIVKYFGSE